MKSPDFIYLLIFGCTCSMQKLPGQGSKPCQSSNPSHSSDNARSLTHCTTKELLKSPDFRVREVCLCPGLPLTSQMTLAEICDLARPPSESSSVKQGQSW